MADISEFTFGAEVTNKEEDDKKILIVDFSDSPRKNLQRSLDMASLMIVFKKLDFGYDILIIREYGFEIELKKI